MSMSAARRVILLFLIFALGTVTALAQTRRKARQTKPKPGEPKFEVNVTAGTGKEGERLLKESARRDAIRSKFFEERGKCRDLLKAGMLQGAETVCKSAVKLAEQLEAHSKLERSGAYEAVGHVMLGQQRYEEALEYYSRALESVEPRLTDTSAELAQLYGNLAMTNHVLGRLDKALELYRKAGKIYRAAYDDFGKDDKDEWVRNVRQSYLNSLKTLLGYHRNAAEEAGAASEVEEVEKLLNSLP
jgi:tetratricopeptide (TPR) repeat protein